MKSGKAFRTNKTVAYNGALLTIVGVLFYSIIIMVYVIIRSSVSIYVIMPKGERHAIMWTNSFSIAYSVAVFSITMAFISSVGGAVSSVILKKLLLYFNPEFNFRKAIFISCMTALCLLSIIYVLLYIVLKDRMSVKYIETLLFWFLFPAIISFAICIIGGSKLNSLLVKNCQP